MSAPTGCTSFPWLKDYEINEGLDLYDYMPTNYSSAYPWVRDYVYGSTNLLVAGGGRRQYAAGHLPAIPGADPPAEPSRRFGGRHGRADCQPAALLRPLAGFPDADLGDQYQHGGREPDRQRHYQRQSRR